MQTNSNRKNLDAFCRIFLVEMAIETKTLLNRIIFTKQHRNITRFIHTLSNKLKGMNRVDWAELYSLFLIRWPHVFAFEEIFSDGQNLKTTFLSTTFLAVSVLNPIDLLSVHRVRTTIKIIFISIHFSSAPF